MFAELCSFFWLLECTTPLCRYLLMLINDGDEPMLVAVVVFLVSA
jgi:hypothetical protein